MKMSKINIIKCQICDNEIQTIFHDGTIRQIPNENGELEEWYYFACTNCGNSYKIRKPETIDITKQDK
jgi:transcription elongation factor Elf1